MKERQRVNKRVGVGESTTEIYTITNSGMDVVHYES